MKNNYKYLDSKTYEIVDSNVIAVDGRLAKTISLLNKKGYYIEIYNLASIRLPFAISDVVYNLINEKLLYVDNNIDKIKKIIKYAASESTMIIFKENYKFDELPAGYEMHDNCIFYYLTILKDTKTISFKTLVELDHELTKSISDLEDWAQNLPKII